MGSCQVCLHISYKITVCRVFTDLLASSVQILSQKQEILDTVIAEKVRVRLDLHDDAQLLICRA